jgi:hypothetical protein
MVEHPDGFEKETADGWNVYSSLDAYNCSFLKRPELIAYQSSFFRSIEARTCRMRIPSSWRTTLYALVLCKL